MRRSLAKRRAYATAYSIVQMAICYGYVPELLQVKELNRAFDAALDERKQQVMADSVKRITQDIELEDNSDLDIETIERDSQ